MKVDILQVDADGYLKERGYLRLPNNEPFNPDAAWHQCNWSCYSDKKPAGYNSSLMYCNEDVIFSPHSPKGGYYSISSKSKEWEWNKSLIDAYANARDNALWSAYISSPEVKEQMKNAMDLTAEYIKIKQRQKPGSMTYYEATLLINHDVLNSKGMDSGVFKGTASQIIANLEKFVPEHTQIDIDSCYDSPQNEKGLNGKVIAEDDRYSVMYNPSSQIALIYKKHSAEALKAQIGQQYSDPEVYSEASLAVKALCREMLEDHFNKGLKQADYNNMVVLPDSDVVVCYDKDTDGLMVGNIINDEYYPYEIWSKYDHTIELDENIENIAAKFALAEENNKSKGL